MKSYLVWVGLLSLAVLLPGCDKSPPANAQVVETETPERQVEDLIKAVLNAGPHPKDGEAKSADDDTQEG